jgi:excisionase family DNA binding protein
MPVPVCRTVQEAYDAGRADALATPAAGPELAAKVAELIGPWLEQIAARRHRLLTVTEATEQLGMSRNSFYDLMYRGELTSVQIPGKGGRQSSRRIEQTEIDALIARHRVSAASTLGGVL